MSTSIYDNADWWKCWPMNLGYALHGEPIIPEAVDGALEALTERERAVIYMRFRDGMTCEECGKKFGVTGERIRQVEAKALRKLRHSDRFGKLRVVPYEDFKAMEARALNAEHALKNSGVRIDMIITAAECLKRFLEEYPESNKELDDIDDMAIADLNLSVRSFNCLKRANINTVGDLREMDREKLTRVRNLGRRSFDEIMGKLKELGVSLKGEDEDEDV